MSGIWNINSTYNLNSRKIMNKLSFELGEEFLARIVDADALEGEVLLKMLDGWQFTAELANKSENIPEGVLRFKVEDFQDGKLKLKVLNQEKAPDAEIDNLIKTLEEQNVEISKNDFKILDKMIKYDMPLTRENISQVKSIFEFKSKIENDPEEIDSFIQKFLKSKGISPETPKAMEINIKLKAFFNEFKGFTENDILTLMENDLDINQENVKSFNRVFKEPQAIYKELVSFSEKLEKNDTHKISIKPSLNDMENADMPDGQIQKKGQKIENAPGTSDNGPDEITGKLKSETHSKILDLKEKADIIKGEINIKSDKIKSIITEIISRASEGEANIKESITGFLQQNGNDFKVFNTISNQYYYLDLPVKMENHDYGCKLIIKDDRKKGKKIDSNDVKIAASISTENMGTVDSYITVKNYSMRVEIKSEDRFVKVINSAKEILMTELSQLGYNISVKVSKWDKPLNISDSREFFQDNDLMNINIRV